MSHLGLRFLNEADGTLQTCPVPCESGNGRLAVRARSLPGVKRMAVALDEDGTVRARWEIGVDGDEEVTFHLEVDEGGAVHLVGGGRDVDTLPPDPGFEPPPPIVRPEPGCESLDVGVLLDATTRVQRSAFLLQSPEVRDDFLARLETFLEGLVAPYRHTRLAAFAFGDHEMLDVDVRAEELKPKYLLYPERRAERRLRESTPEDVVETLRQVPATPGGDLVDGLADALHAAGELRWRPEARKLLIVTGDSPGHSTEHPMPPEADLCARYRDVDVEALGLHRQGVEIVTLYHDPTGMQVELENEAVRRLVMGARDQYRRLASYPGLALEAASFGAVGAVETVLASPALIGRRSAYGLLVELSHPGPA